MRRNYLPGDLGPQFVMPEAHGWKGLYLRLFGIPDVRAHLTADYALRTLAGLSFTSMLDVGCGNGVITCCLASHHPMRTVVGVDRDELSLNFARALARQNGLDKLSFRNADVESEDLAGAYDLVTCFSVFQFIRDCDQMVREMNRVLVSGGHLLLQLPSANRVEYLMKVASIRRRYPAFHEARGPFTAVEARQLLTENGFKVIRMDEAIKGPSVLAKELFYLSLSVNRMVNHACSPLLNWITALDGRYRGRGNGLFVLARKVQER